MGHTLSLSTFGKSPLAISCGDWAKQANGSVKISLGDTVVLATACLSKKTSVLSYFPLTVEYQERTYAMGKIPGGFLKKEGKPKDAEILVARLIDRPIRPLFPENFMNEVQVVATVLSSDGENDPDIVAINGASAALFISNIPFSQPVGAVRVGCVESRFIVNPTYEERAISTFDLVVVGTQEKIAMLEGGFDQIDEETVLEAIEFAHPYIKEIIRLQHELRAKCGKNKIVAEPAKHSEPLVKLVTEKAMPKLTDSYGKAFKKEDHERIIGEIIAYLKAEIIKDENKTIFLTDKPEGEIEAILAKLEEDYARKRIIESELRPDGRAVKDVRQITAEVGALPRTHGSGLFTRGQTQALAVVTLGTSSDEQTVEDFEGRRHKSFMLQYNFPPFSVGETKPMRGPSRRDIGHGTLAERAISSVLPTKDEFPYTVRVVSEILESNGSSSMATVCATSLALMDAGVPTQEPVAGIAMGLVQEGHNHKILTDIAGIEDHSGDMDFKVAGTRNGIVAIQLDIKIEGITFEIIKETLERAKAGRLHILDKMEMALKEPRKHLSKYAPKIKTFKIDPDKIGTLIGPGGKNIRKLSKNNNVTIDINDETETVFVVAQNEEDLERATRQIMGLIRETEVGDVYEDAVVERIVNFGAFCEFAPGKSGLVHVSEISNDYIKDVTSVIKEGDKVKVKVISIDNMGRVNLSIKQAQE